MIRQVSGAFALVVGTVALAAAASAKPAVPEGARYVAMGSSYAAGPGLGATKPGTPARCTRTPANYPTLLAAQLKLDLVDVSCGGATTAHILGPWNELPAQIDAVTPDTRLVTVTIGGNDVSFVRNLATGMCKGVDCQPQLIPTEADWTRLEANLRAIVSKVRERAPKVRVVFVDYITILPEGRVCPATPLEGRSLAVVRDIYRRLAAVTAKAARAERADLLAAGALSRRHTPCDAQPWSIGAPGSAPGTPWHLNAAGMQAVAQALARKLGG
jgi:lysophospholipase L1-like esterase